MNINLPNNSQNYFTQNDKNNVSHTRNKSQQNPMSLIKSIQFGIQQNNPLIEESDNVKKANKQIYKQN